MQTLLQMYLLKAKQPELDSLLISPTWETAGSGVQGQLSE